MYGSKEELIEMLKLPSLNKTKILTNTQTRNKIYTTPHASSPDTFEKVVSDKSSTRKGHFRDDVETISEISDAVFTTEKSVDVSKSDNIAQSYRDKILQRFNTVKEQAKMSRKAQNISRRDARKRSIEQIVHEVSKIGANIKSARSKINQGKEDTNKEFLFFHFDKEEKENNTTIKDIQHEDCDLENTFDNKKPMVDYIMPDQLNFNIGISERDSYFFPDNSPVGSATADEMPRILEGEGFCINLKDRPPKHQLNKLEKRLISVDERTWYSREGILDIVANPTVNHCLKPEIQANIGDELIFRAPKVVNDLEKIIVIEENVLKLSLFSLKFSHHPLFSAEHVLEEQLKSAYQKYTSFLENNTLQKLKNQLEVLKHTRKFDNTAAEHETVNEIIILRNEIFKEGKIQRQYLKTTLELWKAIKKLRQRQNYCNTSVKLLIFVEKVDVNLEKENQDKMLMEMLEDVLKNQEELFKRKLDEYNKKNEYDISSANQDDLEKAQFKPVYDVDSDKIKYELQKKFEESFKAPGEPNLTLMLTEENEITIDVEDKQEISRRKAVKSTKMLLKLTCNKVPVAKSKILTLNDDFLVNINEEFYIQLTDIPDHINLEIVEISKGLMNRKLCELEIPLPAHRAAQKKDTACTLTFEKNEFIDDKQKELGSAFNFRKFLEENKLFLKTNSVGNMIVSGYLNYRLVWRNSESHQSSDLYSANAKAVSVLDKLGAINQQILAEWIGFKELDPQHPKNSAIYDYLELIHQRTLLPSDSEGTFNYFRLNRQFNFCQISEIDRNLRFQCLELRDQNEIDFRGIAIPIRTKEMPVEILNECKKHPSF